MKHLLQLISIITLYACSSTYYIMPKDFDTINKKLKDKNIYLVVDDVKRKIKARNLTIANDTTSYFEPRLKINKTLQTTKIKEIRDEYHAAGAIQGFAFGLVIGTFSGVVLSGKYAEGLEFGYFSIPFIVGVIGGTLLGSAKGANDIYILQKESTKNKLMD